MNPNPIGPSNSSFQSAVLGHWHLPSYYISPNPLPNLFCDLPSCCEIPSPIPPYESARCRSKDPKDSGWLDALKAIGVKITSGNHERS